MSSSKQNDLFRQIIMDHYQNPRNKGLAPDPRGYMTVHLKNPSCGDDLTVQLKVRGNTVEEVRQEGAGCSICCASASMMAEALEKLDIEAAQEIIKHFHHMIQSEDYDAELIGDAVSLQGVAQLPQRVKCATLGWQASRRGLAKIQEERAEGQRETEDSEGSITVADVEKEETI